MIKVVVAFFRNKSRSARSEEERSELVCSLLHWVTFNERWARWTVALRSEDQHPFHYPTLFYNVQIRKWLAKAQLGRSTQRPYHLRRTCWLKAWYNVLGSTQDNGLHYRATPRRLSLGLHLSSEANSPFHSLWQNTALTILCLLMCC